jgi:hypothetical protein
MGATDRPRIARECVCCGSTELRSRPAILMPFVASRVFGWEPVEIDESWGLRDVPTGMAYSICCTLACTSCGLVFLDLRFDEDEAGRLYAGYRDEEYVSQRLRYEPGYRQTNEMLVGGSAWIPQIEDFLRPHLSAARNVLDWGGDTGLNTPFRGEAALHHVYDISVTPLVPGAQRVDLDEIAETAYDLIVLSHVLEHVSFPLELVNEVRRIMRPETLLWVELPRENLFRTASCPEDAYLEKRHWHEHVNFFTNEALARLLERADLDVVDSCALEVDFGDSKRMIIGAVCRLPQEHQASAQAVEK